MGMKRQTYERRFRELYDEVVQFVDNEIQEWRNRRLEVRKNQISPERIIYILEWREQPLNALALELLHCSGYPHIAFHYDQYLHAIERLPRTPERKYAEFSQLVLLLDGFLRDTLIAEARKIALKDGFFAKIKDGYLIVPIGDTEFRIYYSRSVYGWTVIEPQGFRDYKCGEYHPLEFFPHLLKALVLQHLL
jgi:hypothetical protein